MFAISGMVGFVSWHHSKSCRFPGFQYMKLGHFDACDTWNYCNLFRTMIKWLVLQVNIYLVAKKVPNFVSQVYFIRCILMILILILQQTLRSLCCWPLPLQGKQYLAAPRYEAGLGQFGWHELVGWHDMGVGVSKTITWGFDRICSFLLVGGWCIFPLYVWHCETGAQTNLHLYGSNL